ncbi:MULTISPECIES: hypothetical protein [unclassified Nesterenkonia]|uniref:YunG family protein n=1 Tax=unclassified Nesterenkonia TaxID=2629769 RepID=UPI001A910C7D|nr:MULTISPECIES: hypothetical protein [unclassified Nesterenkonia]
MAHTLKDIEQAFRASWGADTTCLAPSSLPAWGPDNPAHGQCGPTALVLQDLLGGELLIADVSAGDGSGAGSGAVHYWNKLLGGLEVDLTCEQFSSHHIVGEPRVVVRPPEGPRAHIGEYQLLRRRVFSALNLG